MKRTPQEMVKCLKEMGLGQQQRSKVMATFRDAGEEEAIEQAQELLAGDQAAIAGAKQAARTLLGIKI